MEKICWKGKAFKALSFGKSSKNAGRNFSGSITIFHRGGGSKKLLRRVDFQRKNVARGLVERIEYDPNRTARIALVRWFNIKSNESNASVPNSNLKDFLINTMRGHYKHRNPTGASLSQFSLFKKKSEVHVAFSYILACNDLKSGDEVFNMETALTKVSSGSRFDEGATMFHQTRSSDFQRNKSMVYKTEPGTTMEVAPNYSEVFPVEKASTQKIGISLPLWLAPLGSVIHNVELYPGEGGKLVRAAGTSAQLVQKPLTKIETSASIFSDPRNVPSIVQKSTSTCTIRLPSGQQQLIDLRCRATIGVVSNVDHGARILRKAGQNRWLGFRPVVRGVAMNPIDHPHGGGEGRTKGSSVSPWGKPTKGRRTRPLAKRRVSIRSR